VILKQTTGTRSSQWVFGTNGHVDEENAFASLASFEGVARIHGRGMLISFDVLFFYAVNIVADGYDRLNL